MCTAISYHGSSHYFGRNLDLEYGYREQITITPRNYPFTFRHLPSISNHFAMIGMATVADDYPLYYEATNECGLSVAGLNFPSLAHYNKVRENRQNIASFELIPWLLSQYRTVAEVQSAFAQINITDTAFSRALQPTPLHFMVADRDASIVIESTQEGLCCYDNPIGVMTNAPAFPYHMTRLTDFQALSPLPPENRFDPGENLTPYSGAMGAIGLPGDWSSVSRFIRAAFVKCNSPSFDCEEESVNHFFRILQSVAMPMGSVQLKPGLYDITRYSCCCNTQTCKYYYTTYRNSAITCVDMGKEDLNHNRLITYALQDTPIIHIQNQR